MHIRRMRMTSSIQWTASGVCGAGLGGSINAWRNKELPVSSCTKHRWIRQPRWCAVTRHLMQQAIDKRLVQLLLAFWRMATKIAKTFFLNSEWTVDVYINVWLIVIIIKHSWTNTRTHMLVNSWCLWVTFYRKWPESQKLFYWPRRIGCPSLMVKPWRQKEPPSASVMSSHRQSQVWAPSHTVHFHIVNGSSSLCFPLFVLRPFQAQSI